MKTTKLDAVFGWFMRVLATWLNLHVFLINSRPLDGEASVDDIPEGHVIRYLAHEDIPRVGNVRELNLPESFVGPALERGDVCIGYFDGDLLVSYFWCGFDEVPMQAGLWARVPPNYSYAYKALTIESHRGLHLQHKLTHASDRQLVERGLTHNIEYIAIYNFAQRIASQRYGNSTVGIAGYLKLGNRTYPFRSPKVRDIGFEFYDPPDASG